MPAAATNASAGLSASGFVIVPLNMEQELTKNICVFARLGWNDGKTESFAFTAIDRLATDGISISGQRWRRPFDTVATELTVSAISGVHALYLAHGGYDFLIGDGHWQYGPEYILETYYSAWLFPGFFVGFDLQHDSSSTSDLRRRVAAIERDLDIPAGAMPEVALRFCLSHPAVSTVIPGMRSRVNVDFNCSIPGKGPLPEKVLAILQTHAWARNFYGE